MKTFPIQTLGALFSLVKFPIALAVSFTTLMGCLLFRAEWSAGALLPAVSVLFLAGGACTVNQIQERRTDALMERTRRRPLPSGRIGLFGAWCVASVAIAVGIGGLAHYAHPSALALGLFALLWYNGVYVFLKRKTAFAVMPGAWIGAVAPVIGWLAAGGSARDPRILSVALFMGIWQVPHFWLLVLMHGPDYENAGLPTPARRCTRRQLAWLTYAWILATAAFSFALPFFGLLHGSRWVLAFQCVLVICLVAEGARLLGRGERTAVYRRAFHALNTFALIVLLMVCATRLWRG